MQTIYANAKPTSMNGVLAFNYSPCGPDNLYGVELHDESAIAEFIMSKKPNAGENEVAVLFVATSIRPFFTYHHEHSDNYIKCDCVLVHWGIVSGDQIGKYMQGNVVETHHIFEQNSYGTTFNFEFIQQTSLTHAVATIVAMLEGHKAGKLAEKKLEKSNAEKLRNMLNY